MIRFLFLCFLIVPFQSITAQHNIIPEPVQYQNNGEYFDLGNGLNIVTHTNDSQVENYIQQFKTYLQEADIQIENKDQENNVLNLAINSSNEKELGEEGYHLLIKENKINLTANNATGIFNGLQTLKQSLPPNLKKAKLSKPDLLKIEGCEIIDYPRFKWRGLMLDVSRHFFTVDEVKAYLDKMSEYKFNVFHWHLTDDNGWRIEIKAYPKLTEIGAWRVERHGRFGKNRQAPQAGEETSYGGFYTQEDIKEIVQYATDRNITIVPEIDVPGHSMALLAAYPELSTKKEPKYVSPGNKFAEWYGNGRFKMLVENMLNPIDENVYEFLDVVFGEVSELFPGEYIHMGGDECYHGYWEEDANIQAFMKTNNIANGEELQSYFVGRVEEIINSKGKKMIGWDEILLGGLAENAAVMSWRGMEGGIKAAQMGHNVVMSPTTYAYLDYTQGDYSVENKIYADLSLEKTYLFEPLPEGVNEKYILGGQGNLWTEAIPTLPYAFYMTYPRAFALSESLWSPKEKKDWNTFVAKVKTHFNRFDQTNNNICKAVYDPIIKVYKSGDKLMCELSNSIPGTEIYYTIDNTYPVKFGVKYNGAFEIPDGDLSLRVRTFRNGEELGRELMVHRDALMKRAK